MVRTDPVGWLPATDPREEDNQIGELGRDNDDPETVIGGQIEN